MGRHVKKKPREPNPSTKEKLKTIKKEKKLKLKQKRARLVVRNLPFDVTEDNLKEHFEKFGVIEDVKILKKEDGKLLGCGFVQFQLVQKAAKARHHLNGKPFLGREITVDFALAKDKYNTKKNVEVKQEDEVKVKEEPVDGDEDVEVKTEDQNAEGGEENEDESKMSDSSEDEDVKEESDEEEEGEEDEDTDSEQKPAKKPRFESHDVSEGRTVFIKNLPFSATNEDLKECMIQFGPIYYALVCVDKFTEHSKGTAFVKFRNAEDAEKALTAGTELTLMGNVLDCHKAIDRNEILRKASDKKEGSEKKDSRNLYLVKEGVIVAGSKSAEGVSASDMAKRLQIEQYKTQMLRNLNMFVSRDRLVVHNLPPSWDDKKFKALVVKNSPKNAEIREARIMRDLKNVDANGVGRSKEFGFVAFSRHEDALAALRALNNNPNIFSASRRPIVTFSVENRSMVKAKQKRLEKSRQKNPKCKEFDPNVVKADEKKKQKLAENDEKKRQKLVGNNDKNAAEQSKFVGVAAKPGVQKMRSRYNLKTQAKLHHANLKKEKKMKKLAKKPLSERKQDFIKQPKQKINKKKPTNDHFGKLVSDYKKKLLAVPDKNKSKWYE